jgi:uncharacterized protein
MSTAGIILKTVERCNINCSYCYYFNSKDQSYKTRKPYITNEMVSNFIEFIKSGVNDLKITNLVVEFHGGEPLMQKKAEFASMCQSIRNQLENYATIKSVTFALQTNGILIDEEWIDIFKKHKVGIGA